MSHKSKHRKHKFWIKTSAIIGCSIFILGSSTVLFGNNISSIEAVKRYYPKDPTTFDETDKNWKLTREYGEDPRLKYDRIYS